MAEIALKMRCKKVEEQNGVFSKVPEIKRQKMLVLEKKNYLFCNYRHSTSGSVLFPGCNFSILLSKTGKLIELLKKHAGMGL